MWTTGWLASALLGAAVLGAQPNGSHEVTGRVVDVVRDEDGSLTLVLAVSDEEELTLLVGPDTEVSSEGETIGHDELAEALDATAKARYRETASGLLLESLELRWPDLDE